MISLNHYQDYSWPFGPHALKSIKGVRESPYCDVLQFEIDNKIQHKFYSFFLSQNYYLTSYRKGLERLL